MSFFAKKHLKKKKKQSKKKNDLQYYAQLIQHIIYFEKNQMTKTQKQKIHICNNIDTSDLPIKLCQN